MHVDGGKSDWMMVRYPGEGGESDQKNIHWLNDKNVDRCTSDLVVNGEETCDLTLHRGISNLTNIHGMNGLELTKLVRFEEIRSRGVQEQA